MIRSFVVPSAVVVLIGCGGVVDDDPPRIETKSNVATTFDPSRFANGSMPNGFPFTNAAGQAATYSTTGAVNLTNEFFQDLGTNGRRCVTCHQPSEGWAISAASVAARFEASAGLDPIFRTNDGSISPNADVSTLEARRTAYAMLTSKGLIRVGIGVPLGADYELVAVDDPYGFASAAELSLFRRPLPSANLNLSAVMWDGRESLPGRAIRGDLASQANDATVGHAAGITLSDAQREAIVAFETSLFFAQTLDATATSLSVAGARGGPQALSQQTFYIGINDLFGDARTGAAFTPIVFSIYDAWSAGKNTSSGKIADARRAIARGQALFNTKPIQIRGVSGINDEAVFGRPETVSGTCTTCHDSPNVGNHSVAAPLDIGLTDASRRTPDMPLYTFRSKATGELKETTDPGRALISGRFKDIGRFKGPVLRGLAARAPYFHNGSAATLDDAVRFYDERFGIGFTDGERADLVAFLNAL